MGNIALLLWALACLVIFMYYPGAISQIQDATLYDFATLPEKLSRISIVKYILDLLVSILGMAFYGTACISLGLAISHVFHLDEIITHDSASLRRALIPTYFLLGNAIFSVVLLTLASVLSLSRNISVIVLLLGLFSGLKYFRKIHAPTFPVEVGYGKALRFASITLLVVATFHSSARLSYDASSMYLSVAKLTAIENHAHFYMENSFPVSVLHSVIQSSAIIQVFGDQSARMISWLFGVTIIVFAISLAKVIRISSLAQKILPILILTSTAFFDQLGDGKVDLLGTAYSLAAVFWLVVNSREQRHNKYLYLLSGFLIGFSSILRPYNAFLLGVFVLLYISREIKFTRTFFAEAAAQLGWMAAGAIGFALYHSIINQIVLHSPIAFLNSLTTVDPNNAPWDYNPESEWIQKLLYPFIVTFKNSGASLGNITPLVVVFLPSLIAYDIRKNMWIQKDEMPLFVSTCLVLLAWILMVFSIVEVRYVMFLWIIVFLYIAEIIASAIRSQNLILQGLAISSTFILISFIFVRSLYVSVSTYSPINNRGNPVCFDTEHCQIIASINSEANQGDRILTFSGLRYYLREDLFACSTSHDEFRFFQSLNPDDAEEFWLEVYRRGYKYIAFEEGYVTDSAQIKVIPRPNNTPPWITLMPIFGNSDDIKIAYQIDVISPPINVEWVCIKNNNTDKWEIIQIAR